MTITTNEIIYGGGYLIIAGGILAISSLVLALLLVVRRGTLFGSKKTALQIYDIWCGLAIASTLWFVVLCLLPSVAIWFVLRYISQRTEKSAPCPTS